MLMSFNLDITYLAVMLGFLVLIIAKPIKYTLFDPAKEMAYIQLSPQQKSQGKVAVDVIGTRLGKGSGSILQSWLIMALATPEVITIAPISFLVFVLVVFMWIYAVRLLTPMLSVDGPLETKIEAQTAQG